MSGFGDDYDKTYDHNHDGHLDRWEQSEKDYNIEESVRWMENHSSGSSGDAEGCCYLVLIAVAVLLIIGLIDVILF